MRILVDAARRTNERCKVFVAFAAKFLHRNKAISPGTALKG